MLLSSVVPMQLMASLPYKCQPYILKSVMATMTSAIPVKSKSHKEDSASKGEIRRAQASKQGVSSPQAIWTNRAQVWTGGCSCHHKLPQLTQQPHHYIVTPQAVENTIIGWLAEIYNGSQPSHQVANMVRRTSDSCLACS